MRRIIFTIVMMLGILDLTFGQQIQYSTLTVEPILVPTQLKGCKTEILQLKITNTDQNNPYDGFELLFSSQTTHVVFDNFQDPNVTTDVLGNKLTILTLAAGEVLVIDIPVRRNCDQILLQSQPPASLAIKLGTNTSNDFTFSFNVVTNGLLSFKNTLSTNLIYTGHKGDINQTRSFVFENSNLEFNGSLFFRDNLSHNIQINSISLRIDNTIVQLPFNVQTNGMQRIIELDIDLLSVGAGARVEIIENFDVIDCPVSSSNVVLKWGCNKEYCYDFDLDPSTSETIQSVEINRGTAVPLLKAETSGVYPDACVDGGPRRMQCVIKNTSDAPGFDVRLNFALNSFGSPKPMNLARNFRITTFSSNIVMDDIIDPQLQIYTSNLVNNYTNGSVSLTHPFLLWNYTLNNFQNTYSTPIPLYKEIPGVIDNNTDDIFKEMIMFLKVFPVGAEIIFEWDEYDVCVKNLVSGLAFGEYQMNGNYTYYYDECGVKKFFESSRLDYSGIGYGYIAPTLLSTKQSAANNMFGCTECGTGNCFGGCPDAVSTSCGGDKLNNGSGLSTCDFTETIEIQNYNLSINNSPNTKFPINGENFRIAVEVITEGNLVPAQELIFCEKMLI